MSRETFTAALKAGQISSSQIAKMTKGGSLGGTIGNIMTKGGTIKVAGFSGGALTTAKQLAALPVTPLVKKSQTISNARAVATAPRVPTNFPISPKPVVAAAASSPAASGFDFGALGAGALALGDVALDISPVGLGMGILSDVGNLAGMSLNALGLGGKKKAGVRYGRSRRHGASYWRNKYESMYWKAKYENARYGHGRMK